MEKDTLILLAVAAVGLYLLSRENQGNTNAGEDYTGATGYTQFQGLKSGLQQAGVNALNGLGNSIVGKINSLFSGHSFPTEQNYGGGGATSAGGTSTTFV